MFNAAMPEAAVNEDCHSFWTEDDVRPHFPISALNGLVNPVAVAKGV